MKRWTLALIILSVVLLPPVHAAATDALTQNTKGMFEKFLSWYATDEQGNFTGYNLERKVVDFIIFFILFMSITALGLTKAFGGQYGGFKAAGGNPIRALTVVIGLMLTIALVAFTNVSIALFFPFAKNLLFFLAWAMIFFLLRLMGLKQIVWAIILSIIITYLLFHAGSWLICEFGDEKCSLNLTFAKAFKPDIEGKKPDVGIGKQGSPWKPAEPPGTKDIRIQATISCGIKSEDFALFTLAKATNVFSFTGKDECTLSVKKFGKLVEKCAINAFGQETTGDCTKAAVSMKAGKDVFKEGVILFRGMDYLGGGLSQITVTALFKGSSKTPEDGKVDGDIPEQSEDKTPPDEPEAQKKGKNLWQKIPTGVKVGFPIAILLILLLLSKRLGKVKRQKDVKGIGDVLDHMLALIKQKIGEEKKPGDPPGLKDLEKGLRHRKEFDGSELKDRVAVARRMKPILGLVRKNDKELERLADTLLPQQEILREDAQRLDMMYEKQQQKYHADRERLGLKHLGQEFSQQRERVKELVMLLGKELAKSELPQAMAEVDQALKQGSVSDPAFDSLEGHYRQLDDRARVQKKLMEEIIQHWRNVQPAAEEMQAKVAEAEKWLRDHKKDISALRKVLAKLRKRNFEAPVISKQLPELLDHTKTLYHEEKEHVFRLLNTQDYLVNKVIELEVDGARPTFKILRVDEFQLHLVQIDTDGATVDLPKLLPDHPKLPSQFRISVHGIEEQLHRIVKQEQEALRREVEALVKGNRLDNAKREELFARFKKTNILSEDYWHALLRKHDAKYSLEWGRALDALKESTLEGYYRDEGKPAYIAYVREHLATLRKERRHETPEMHKEYREVFDRVVQVPRKKDPAWTEAEIKEGLKGLEP
ncbi:MAG: hypothetical protein V1735_02325 [Nanoarchaeota archaeon]